MELLSRPESCRYVFEDVPDMLAPLVLDRSFCGAVCARAFLLGTMGALEGAWIGSVVGDAEAVASAFRAVYFHAAAESERISGACPVGRP